MQQYEGLGDWADTTGAKVAQPQRHASEVSRAPQILPGAV